MIPAEHGCSKKIGVLLLLACTACSKTEPNDQAEAPEPVASSSIAVDAAATASAQPPSDASAASSQRPEAGAGAPLQVLGKEGWRPAAEASRILHVGDSMVPLVGNYLRPILHADGRRYEIVSIPSSSTLSWARDHGLRDALYRYDPEVVVISLGSNELFDPNPQRRAAAIRQVVSEARDRPCLWIGPPAWKKDKGFIAVLRANVAPCRYFDSTRLRLPRMGDGRHPSWTGGYEWARAVWMELGGTTPVPAGDVRPR